MEGWKDKAHRPELREALRKRYGVGYQKKFAHEVGVHEQTVWYWLNAGKKPGDIALQRIAALSPALLRYFMEAA